MIDSGTTPDFRHLGVPLFHGAPAASIPERAGLIRATRQQRQIICATDFASMRALLDFIMRDCCQGRPELCGGVAVSACDGAASGGKEAADV